jgi:hypothetical protein
MWIGLTEFKNYQVISTDGAIGRLVDLIFPQGQWSVRYLLVWSQELNRALALPASGILQVYRDEYFLRFDAAQDRVEASPELDVTRRLERREEEQLYEHYGWPPYWLQGEHDVTPIGVLSGEPEDTGSPDVTTFDHPELQGANELVGTYKVHSSEGEFGAVQDVIVADETWLIPGLAISAPAIEGGVLIETDWIERVDWVTKEMYVALPAEFLAEGPVHRPREPLTTQQQRLRERSDQISKTT